MAFSLLQTQKKQQGQLLAETLQTALDNIDYCTRCRIYSEQSLCQICSHPQRQQQICCVVESPADVLAIEQSAAYKGYYFVLHGHLSPIEGIGPHELGIPLLLQLLQKTIHTELIIATGATAEGEATAHYLRQQAAPYVRCSRIAHGIPIGGELEYLDSSTVQHALQRRSIIPTETDKQPNE